MTRWTDLMDEYLLKKAAAGEPFRCIASALGVTRGAAWARYVRLCELNGVSPYRSSRRAHSEQTRQVVLSLKRSGLSHKEVASRVGLRLNQVCGIWNHWRDYEHRRAAA